MSDDVVAALLEALLVAGPQESVQQNVVGFQGGISFKFSAPVTFFVLLREQAAACTIHGSRYPAGQIINLAEAQLRARSGWQLSWSIFHRCRQFALTVLGAAAIACTISGGSPKRTFSGIT